jgi:hypothetical protein
VLGTDWASAVARFVFAAAAVASYRAAVTWSLRSSPGKNNRSSPEEMWYTESLGVLSIAKLSGTPAGTHEN